MTSKSIGKEVESEKKKTFSNLDLFCLIAIKREIHRLLVVVIMSVVFLLLSLPLFSSRSYYMSVFSPIPGVFSFQFTAMHEEG